MDYRQEFTLKLIGAFVFNLALIGIYSLFFMAAVTFSSDDIWALTVVFFGGWIGHLFWMQNFMKNRNFKWRWDQKPMTWVKCHYYASGKDELGFISKNQFFNSLKYYLKTTDPTSFSSNRVWVDFVTQYGKRIKAGTCLRNISLYNVKKTTPPSWSKYGPNGIDIKEALSAS